MISAIGVRNVVENHVDFTQSRNLIIAGVIFVCGLGFSDGLTFTIAGTSVTLTALAVAAIAGIFLMPSCRATTITSEKTSQVTRTAVLT